MIHRHRARESALQVLFQMAVRGQNADDALAIFTKNFEHHKQDAPFINELVMGVQQNLERIDAKIEEHSHHWKLHRISPLEKSLLRLALYEMLYGEKLAGPIIIDEAMELMKRYGKEEASGFVNGLLDAVWKSTQET